MPITPYEFELTAEKRAAYARIAYRAADELLALDKDLTYRPGLLAVAAMLITGYARAHNVPIKPCMPTVLQMALDFDEISPA